MTTLQKDVAKARLRRSSGRFCTSIDQGLARTAGFVYNPSGFCTCCGQKAFWSRRGLGYCHDCVREDAVYRHESVKHHFSHS